MTPEYKALLSEFQDKAKAMNIATLVFAANDTDFHANICIDGKNEKHQNLADVNQMAKTHFIVNNLIELKW